MGTCYELGHGVDQDRDQAYLLYKESAQKDYVQAMENLAYLTFDNGRSSKSAENY
jgi:TPR repeat protein